MPYKIHLEAETNIYDMFILFQVTKQFFYLCI